MGAFLAGPPRVRGGACCSSGGRADAPVSDHGETHTERAKRGPPWRYRVLAGVAAAFQLFLTLGCGANDRQEGSLSQAAQTSPAEPVGLDGRERNGLPSLPARPAESGMDVTKLGSARGRETGGRQTEILQCIADGRAQVDAPVWPRIEPLLSAACTEYVGHHGAGFQLAVRYTDGSLASLAIGVRCRGRDELLTTRTAMRIGSVSKIITALLAVELALAGDVRLDDPVETKLGALSGTPAGAATLRELLSHRAQLPELWPADVAMALSRDKTLTWLDVVAQRSSLASRSLDTGSLPGPAGHDGYRNVHYAIAGAYIDQLEGGFAAVLERVLLEPNGWRDIWFEVSSLDPDSIACGHLANALVVDAAHAHSVLALGADWARPAGGLLSTAEQLALIGAQLDAWTAPSDTTAEEGGSARSEDSRQPADARAMLLRPHGVCQSKDQRCLELVRSSLASLADQDKSLVPWSAQSRGPLLAEDDVFALAWAIRRPTRLERARTETAPKHTPALAFGLRGATGDGTAFLLVRPGFLSFAMVSNDDWPYHATSLRAASLTPP